MKGFSFLGALEGHVLPKMSEALLFLVFVSATNVEDKSTVHQSSMRNLLMDNPNPIGKLFKRQLHRLWFLVWKNDTSTLGLFLEFSFQKTPYFTILAR
jgi:hypothetical protein